MKITLKNDKKRIIIKSMLVALQQHGRILRIISRLKFTTGGKKMTLELKEEIKGFFVKLEQIKGFL